MTKTAEAPIQTSRAPVRTAGRPRAHRWKVLATAAAISGLLFALTLEVMVRLAGLDVPRVWEPHPELGWHHIPGATRHFTEEGDGWIQINSLGFRDRERSLAKPPGTFRIMMLGDSMTEAVQVNPDQNFCYLLEKQLKDEGRAVEVLNCGVNGYSPLSELLLLRREGPRYHPDVVVLNLFLDNDVADCHPTLNTTSGQAPEATLDDDQLKFDFSRPEASYASYHREPIHTIRKLSALYRWLRASNERRGRAVAGGTTTIPSRFELYAVPSPPVWQDAWAVMERSLLEIAAETDKLGAKLLIVSLPCGQVVDSAVWQDILQKHPAMETATWDVDGPDQRLRTFAEQHLLHLFQPLGAFRTQVKQSPLFIEKIGHLNVRGHEVLAALLASNLQQNELLPNVEGTAQ